jgi:hypothetical protein
MSDPKRTSFEDLLARALELPEDEQEAFIRNHCDDPDLRAEILALLAKERELGEFMERPAAFAVEVADQIEPPKAEEYAREALAIFNAVHPEGHVTREKAEELLQEILAGRDRQEDVDGGDQ